MYPVAFTTGPTNTTAQIYLDVSIPSGVTPVYADDFGVEMNTKTNTDTGWTIVNDNNGSITYSGSWTYATGRTSYGDYQADIHYTTVNGNYAQYTFTGTGVRLITETYTNAGTVDIYLDNVFQTTVNRNSASRYGQIVLYANTSLAPGTHTIKVVKTSGAYFEFDAFAYLAGSGPYFALAIPSLINLSLSSGGSGNMILQGTNGSPGNSYTVLTTTNISLPLATWLTNTIGSFSGTGAFSNSFSMNPGSQQQYYRVRVP